MPTGSPGGFGGGVQTILSAIHRVRYGFFRFYAPRIGFLIGERGGFGGIFDLVPMIGTFASVESEIVERQVRLEKGEADEPLMVLDLFPGIFDRLPKDIVAGTVEVKAEVLETGEHYYAIRGVICKRSDACDEDWADLVYKHVNTDDLPFSLDDRGSGVKYLFLWLYATDHLELPGKRMSINTALEGHPFKDGIVVHWVHFEDGYLIYDAIGQGPGNWPRVNNAIGINRFRPGVEGIVDALGSPPNVKRPPIDLDRYRY